MEYEGNFVCDYFHDKGNMILILVRMELKFLWHKNLPFFQIQLENLKSL